jgi:hypothetical protein
MSGNYCSQCGNEINSIAKFCPSCGQPVKSTQLASEKPQMYKGQSKSLLDSTSQVLKSQLAGKVVESVKAQIKGTPISSSNPISEGIQQVANTGLDRLGTWSFLILNVLLLFIGYRSDTVMGVVLLSLVFGIFLFLRRKKPYPINWLIKIILILQVLVLLAVIVDSIEYPGVISGLMFLLLGVDLRLIFKKNHPQ